MDENITDQATATAALVKVRDALKRATDNATERTAFLRETIVLHRPMGVLTVAEMADAIGRDRNYVDSVWSSYGETTKGKQTRVVSDVADGAKGNAYQLLADAARNQRGTAGTVGVLRAERDRVVALVYASKILGPSAIAAAVGVDRNHVLRVARRAGLTPAWRKNTKNQYTASASK